MSVFFDNRRTNKKGLCTVYFRIYRDKKMILINSGFSCIPTAFKDGRFIGENTTIEKLNADFKEKYNTFRIWCLDYMDRGQSNKQVKEACEKYLNDGVTYEYAGSDNMSLLDCMYEYIDLCVTSKGTELVYVTTIERIKKYDRHVLLKDISYTWLMKFDVWMAKNIGLKVNSRGQTMRCIRTVFNYALGEEYVNRYPFKKFKIKIEETRHRVLDIDEIKLLKDYPCATEWQRKARDMWMLSFYLFGINNKDLFTMQSLTKGRCQYRRGKTHKLFDVPVPPEAQEIIDRYRGKKFLLDICDRNKDYHVYVKHCNAALQTIGQTIKNGCKYEGDALFPDLTMYWARHSCASVMGELDIPMETISQCLGHSSGRTVTQIYVRFNQKKIDEAQRKMIDALK